MTFHPEQRRATVAVLTELGWYNGTLHLPPMQSVIDFLNSGSPVVKLTRVRTPTHAESLVFVGLRRDGIHLVVPTIDEMIETPGAVGHTTPRQVQVLLAGGTLDGRLEVLRNLRVSDYLRQQMGLAVLRDAVFTPYRGDAAQVRRMPICIVNLALSLGVAQTSGNGNT